MRSCLIHTQRGSMLEECSEGKKKKKRCGNWRIRPSLEKGEEIKKKEEEIKHKPENMQAEGKESMMRLQLRD